MKITRFRCVVCGKLTAGRVPREGGASGDLSARFPRRHSGSDGRPCKGNVEEAEWVDVDRQLVRIGYMSREVAR